MKINNDPVYVKRRRVALAVLIVVLIVLVVCIGRLVGGDETASAGTPQQAAAPAKRAAPAKVEKAAPAVKPAQKQGKEAAPADSSMVRIQRLTGAMTPKSVVASPTGHVFAQNMMYSHSVTALTPDGAIEKTISDAVKLSDFGVKGHPGTSKGAPVEMAFSPDGKTAWVSNYAMYGEGFSPEGADACTGPEGISDSYLYKIDTDSLEIKDVIQVGAVPKYVAATHDGSKVLVTNWCSMDLDVVDTAKGEVVTTIPIDGKHPRGIAITPDDKVAFVAVMGSDKTVRVDLESGKTSDFAATGDGPRHLLVSPDGSKLYISNNGAGTVSEVDATTGKTLREVQVGSEPRSMAISPDGGAIYVGNYGSSTVSKIRTEDFEVVQTEKTDALPIGITYEPTKKRVWVASYGGSIIVFDDSRTV
ncbi:beta-propeller fold lactonase family protein [Janibacter sp. FSL W8-0316]|uniref:beta-propeller fold lactonase family protein n=1 Tax=Janibacter sp. FSL W8-0316 TaxID=2975325 RepID=UPI0030FAE5B4